MKTHEFQAYFRVIFKTAPKRDMHRKSCLFSHRIIKSNLDTESDGEQKSLSTSTVDRTTLRSLLSCTFKNPSRCCFWMAWKTPLDLSSIGALQFSARNIQNSVWTPFLLHVEKELVLPTLKELFCHNNWEVQWFCFKYPKIRLNSSNFSDFPMSSSPNFHQATNFFGISATAWNEVSSACFEWRTLRYGKLRASNGMVAIFAQVLWQSSPSTNYCPLCRKRFQKSCALEKKQKVR